MKKISDLYLSTYLPSSFYICDHSHQFGCYVKRSGNKYLLNEVMPYSNQKPSWFKPSKITMKDLVDLLNNRDVVLSHPSGRPSLVNDLMLDLLKHPDPNILELGKKLEADVKFVAESLEANYASNANMAINCKVSKGNKKYVNTQPLTIAITVKPTASGAHVSYMYIEIEVVPFKPNTLQMAVIIHNPNQIDLFITEKSVDWIKKELSSKGYNFI